MRRVIQFAVFTILLASLSFGQHQGAKPVPPTQGNFGPPASVLSPAPGRSFGPRPSITSLGPTGYTFAPCVLGDCRHLHSRGLGFQGFVAAYPIVIPIFAVPDVPVGPLDESGNPVYAEPSQNEIVGTQGGGASIMYSGQRHVTMAHPVGTQQEAQSRQSRTRPEYAEEDDAPEATAPPPKPEPAAAPAPAAPQNPTVLVFKDGHKLSVTNYAIQGGTLFNFSGEGPRRIAVSDLNLDATVKANDENGVQFRLP